MKISVALATYNGEKFIIEQLESIYKQTKQPDEVIISDDHSTDKTKDLVADYISSHNLSRWSVIDNELSNGITNNFINALQHTSGDIIFLCDQDDVWEPEKVENIVSAFENKTECVISAIKYIDQDGRLINEKTAYTNNKDHIVGLSELCCVCSYLGMSSAFRRNVIEATTESFMRSTSHDWALMVKASNIGEIKYIGQAVQKYRQHSNNASVIKNGSRRENRLSFIQRQLCIMCNSKEYVCENADQDILKSYEGFAKKRINWIKNRSFISIIMNIKNYRRLKYTSRNILADLVASL